MKEIEITRILDGDVRGSSRPIIAETEGGDFFIKLRGSAQGCGALIAEIVVTELAKVLNLNVLPISYARLAPHTPTADKNDELADLLHSSSGLNLAFPLLQNARDISVKDLDKLTIGEKFATLWLDRFVLNPDRNHSNPNLLYHQDKVILIDHGASLRFQYNWSKVTESTPKETGFGYQPHIFESLAETYEWDFWDDIFSKSITREVLHQALSVVPDDFIENLESKGINEVKCDDERRALVFRRKEAYVAFLWKRLKHPRNFALCEPGYEM